MANICHNNLILNAKEEEITTEDVMSILEPSVREVIDCIAKDGNIECHFHTNNSPGIEQALSISRAFKIYGTLKVMEEYGYYTGLYGFRYGNLLTNMVLDINNASDIAISYFSRFFDNVMAIFGPATVFMLHATEFCFKNDKSTINTMRKIAKDRHGKDLINKPILDDKTTLLMFALLLGHEEVAQCLIDDGADITCKNNDLVSPLVAAMWSRHRHPGKSPKNYISHKLIKQIADHVDINEPAKHEVYACCPLNSTPIIHAAMIGDIEMVRYLHDKGAVLDRSVDIWGRDIVAYVESNGEKELIDYVKSIAVGEYNQPKINKAVSLSF